MNVLLTSWQPGVTLTVHRQRASFAGAVHAVGAFETRTHNPVRVCVLRAFWVALRAVWRVGRFRRLPQKAVHITVISHGDMDLGSSRGYVRPYAHRYGTALQPAWNRPGTALPPHWNRSACLMESEIGKE